MNTMDRRPTYDELEKRVRELEKVELLYQRTEYELAHLFNSSLDLICIADINTATFLKVNTAFTRILGYSENELLNRPFLDFVHPDDLASTQAVLEQKLQSGTRVIDFENRYRCKDGRYRWLSWASHPDVTQGRTYAFARDITEKKRYKKQAEESRALLEATSRMASVGGWELDLETQKVLWTRMTGRIHELPDDFVPSLKEAISYYHPDDRKMVADHVDQAVKDGKPYEFEARLITAKGRTKWVKAIGEPTFENGKCIRLSGTFQDITERKTAEQKMTEANQQLKSVIEFLPDPIFVIDNHGIVQMWNRAIADLTGIEPEEMIGKGDHEYALPFYGHRRPMLIDRVLNRDRRFDDQYLLLEKQPDGVMIAQSYHPRIKEGVYLFNKARVLLDARGNPSGAIESMRNISEIKQAEKALFQSELQYRNLFSSIRDAIIVADANRKIVACNPAFTDLFGYSEAEIKGKQTLMIYESKEHFDELGIQLKANFDNPQFIYTVRYKKKSGEIFPGETGVYYMKDAGGEVFGFIGLIRDIADRLQAETALRQSEARLQSLVDNLFDAILVTDQQGTVQFANPAAHKLFGKESGHFNGMAFGFPVLMDESFEIDIIQPDNGFRQAEARATLAEWDGEQSHLISIRDITEKRAAEKERDKVNLQLQQSQKIESIGNLAGGIAHDFNNMLSIILGYSQELLREFHPDDPRHESAMEIVEAANRSAALTRQLLAFSRKQTLQPEVLNLNAVVTNIEKVLRRLIGEDIDINTVLAEDLALVEVDPGQIEQVIMNLAVNARDAMPTGGKLSLETRNVAIDDAYLRKHGIAAKGDYVMLSVTDTGCGMDKQMCEKIFEPFFTTKGKGRGTGLGLSTVYGIIKQSGGYIWVYSEPQIGTTFKIYLPQTRSTQPGEKSFDADDTAQGENELILVVEDEQSLRNLCRTVLQGLNYQVKTAPNGEAALRLIEKNNLKPDLVLTDVVMPEMSGKVLVDRLKKKIPDLRALYMSGYTDDAIVHHGILDKEVPFIQKPFTREKLGKAIQALLRK